MGSIFSEKKADTTKTTCIEITAETFKCIDISAYVPTCIMITSNVPTSEYYEKPRADVEITVAPELQIALINNEAPILNVNMDEDGVYYVTDFDTVYIDITNWDDNVEYVNIFSNQDGEGAVVWVDEAGHRIIWALDDYALDGTQMWLNAQAKESSKLISPQSKVTVMQMEQTDQPNLSSWVSQTEQSVLNITILNYDATYTYADPIVTGGSAVRTDNIISWTLPDVTADTYHEISITATAPLMYESLAGVSGGIVIYCSYADLIGVKSNISSTINTDILGTAIINRGSTTAGFSATTQYYGESSVGYAIEENVPPPPPATLWNMDLLDIAFDEKVAPFIALLPRQDIKIVSTTIVNTYCDGIVQYVQIKEIVEIYPFGAKTYYPSSGVIQQKGTYKLETYNTYRLAP